MIGPDLVRSLHPGAPPTYDTLKIPGAAGNPHSQWRFGTGGRAVWRDRVSTGAAYLTASGSGPGRAEWYPGSLPSGGCAVR